MNYERLTMKDLFFTRKQSALRLAAFRMAGFQMDSVGRMRSMLYYVA